ncbi:hypothetical protein [Nocardia sp. NPDC004711]
MRVQETSRFGLDPDVEIGIAPAAIERKHFADHWVQVLDKCPIS